MLLFSSCSTTKYVPEGKLLLKKNNFEIQGDKKTEKEIKPYLTQKPNTRFAFLPFKLMVYNFHKNNYEEKWDNKLLKYKDSANLFTQIFSLKQAVVYINFKKKVNKWLIDKGQEPVIYSENKTKRTIRNLKLYYRSKGYFNATVGYKVDTITSNKSEVTYIINTGKPTMIDSIQIRIASPVLDTIYHKHKHKSIIKEKTQYIESNLIAEADRLTKIFRNAGVYHFSKYSINYLEIDTLNTNNKTNIILDISDRFIESGDSLVTTPYKVYKINRVKVYTDHSYSKKDYVLQDSAQYNGVDYYAYGMINYKLNKLKKAIFIAPNSKYSDINTDHTRQQLRALNGFKNIRIKYEETVDNTLIAHIYLTPFDPILLKTETEVRHENDKPFGISQKFSIKNRNTFKGNEVLQVSTEASFLNSIDLATDDSSLFGLNSWEWGVDASLNIPRIHNPFSSKDLMNSKKSPNTKFVLGYSNQKNIGLDKQRFTAIYGYNWKPDKKTTHNVDIINAQYIHHLNVSSFFDIYESERRKLKSIHDAILPSTDNWNSYEFFLAAASDPDIRSHPDFDTYKYERINKRYAIITENILVPSIAYQYTYNTQENFTASDFVFFKAGITSSGLLTSLFAKSPEFGEAKQIKGTHIAQYFKLDLEYIKNWSIGSNTVLAYRTKLGIAVPYGNSTSIPFSRSYYAGGPNDIRAWKIYELGPGIENGGLEFNVGNFKLLSNIEYRFDIISSFKGALFIDAGNIWDVSNSELTTDAAKLNSFSSLKNTAIGTGFGLRYDLSFLVLRGDLGFKTYVPYESGRKWFNKAYGKPVVNFGINYPF